MPKIAIMRPKLPSAERITRYLETIDTSRIYSNFGPLVTSLEERLAARYGTGQETVVTVANATLGLMLVLAAQGARPGTLCVMPAWTFIASAHAAMLAGLVPYFVDVHPATWALEPDQVAAEIARAPGPVGAVMPVVPFGAPVDPAVWEAFRQRTGVPVVIDAAAGFDALTAGMVPAVVSLHATKVVGVGEGGFVISSDTDLIRDVRTRANFGFDVRRLATVAASNSKMSEYHAAVGHAALDEWPDIRDEWMSVARAYRESLPRNNRLRFQPGFGDTWIASTCVLSLDDTTGATVAQALAEDGIDTRRWWEDGAHAHPASRSYPAAPLPVTERLARSTVGLPFSRDLAADEVRRVADNLMRVLGPAS